MQAVGGEFCFVHTARHKFMLTKWNNNTDKRRNRNPICEGKKQNFGTQSYGYYLPYKRGQIREKKNWA